MTDTPELLTLAEVAECLGVEVLSMRNGSRTEQCPVVRDGRAVRIAAAGDDPKGWTARAGIVGRIRACAGCSLDVQSHTACLGRYLSPPRQHPVT